MWPLSPECTSTFIRPSPELRSQTKSSNFLNYEPHKPLFKTVLLSLRSVAAVPKNGLIQTPRLRRYPLVMGFSSYESLWYPTTGMGLEEKDSNDLLAFGLDLII
jgi:hypothetical protein